MRKFLKSVIAAAAFTGAIAAVTTPASAQSFSFGFGSGGVSFSYNSGGFCDSWGCPSRYWDMPVYYGPVFYRGDWYQGPVYYRVRFGVREYWVRGAWHRDEWRGNRPVWARNFRVGPALGFEYYDRNGFGVRDDWRRDYYGPNWNRGFNNRPGFPNNNNRSGAGIPGGYSDNNGDFRDDRTGLRLEDALNRGNNFNNPPSSQGGQFNGNNNNRGNFQPGQQPGNNPPNQGGGFPGNGNRGNFQPRVDQPPVNTPPVVQIPPAPQNSGGQDQGRGDRGGNRGNFQPGNNQPSNQGAFPGNGNRGGNFQQRADQPPVNTPPVVQIPPAPQNSGGQDQGRGSRGGNRGNVQPTGLQPPANAPAAQNLPPVQDPQATPTPPNGRAGAGQRDPRADDMEQMRARYRNNNNNN